MSTQGNDPLVIIILDATPGISTSDELSATARMDDNTAEVSRVSLLGHLAAGQDAEGVTLYNSAGKQTQATPREGERCLLFVAVPKHMYLRVVTVIVGSHVWCKKCGFEHPA